MGQDICKLCGKNAELKLSHIIPSFVYKWFKDTSASGYIRFGETPNKRSQDGFKLPWLCEGCEKLLNSWETEFANKIFHPLNKEYNEKIAYKQWFNLFCVSVTWRVLNLYIERNLLKDFPSNVQIAAIESSKIWKNFMLGLSDSLGKNQQFFFALSPISTIDKDSLEDIPSNLNQYLVRVIDMDGAFNQDYSFVYVKLGRIIIIGFINFPLSTSWESRMVNTEKGTMSPYNYEMPDKLVQFVIYKARRVKRVGRRISENQKEKINRSFEKDLDRLANSDSLQAMELDIQLFGKERVFKKED